MTTIHWLQEGEGAQFLRAEYLIHVTLSSFWLP